VIVTVTLPGAINHALAHRTREMHPEETQMTQKFTHFCRGLFFWEGAPSLKIGLMLTGLSLIALSSLTACGTQTVTPTPTTPNRGILGVTVSGLPNTLSANITVTGPTSFRQTLTASQVLGNLEPGTYTVTAANVNASGLEFAANVSGSPVTVEAGGFATANVTYTLQNPGGTGSLSVQLRGLPDGLTPTLVVRGTGGTFPIKPDQTLQNLVPGLYSVTAEPVRQAGAVIDTIFDGTSATVTVNANATVLAKLDFIPRPGTGLLWVGSEASVTGFGFKAFTESALAQSGSPASSLQLAQTFNDISPQRFVGLAMDAARVWTTASSFFNDQSNSAVAAFSIAQAGVPVVRPSPLIRGTNNSLSNLRGLVFDRSGNLWVVSVDNRTLMKFTPDQLQSGTPSPAVTLDLSALETSLFVGPSQVALTFDVQDNLWIGSNARIIKITREQLNTSGVIGSSDVTVRFFNSGRQVLALAFDDSGNLWSASSRGLVKLSATQLAQAGPDESSNPDNDVILILDQIVRGSSATIPSSVAFDNSGNLWAGTDTGTLIRLTPDQLKVSAIITPDVVIQTGVKARVTALTFNPAPSNLPIFQPGTTP
jgi:hypothetical protein